MSERDSTSGGRSRPTYGLPGPVPGGEDSASREPSPADPQRPAPYDPSARPAYDSHGYDSHGYDSHGDDSHGYGSHGSGNQGYDNHGSGPEGAGPVGGAPARPQKRRGIIPLVIGLVLLIVIAPVVTIGGVVWSLGSLVSDQVSGPTVMQGGTEDIPIAANEMIIVYVPSEDAANTTCTAEGTDQGSVTVIPTSGSVTFGEGGSYEQTIGVAAVSDTTVTVTCEGTDAPAYLGPYSLFGIAGPMLIGPAIGILAGLVGLVLVIVGIVKLVRSRRT